MNMRDPGFAGTTLSERDVPAIRKCLSCGSEFESDGFGERICGDCESKKGWKDGIAVTPGRSGWRK